MFLNKKNLDCRFLLSAPGQEVKPCEVMSSQCRSTIREHYGGLSGQAVNGVIRVYLTNIGSNLLVIGVEPYAVFGGFSPKPVLLM